MRERRYPESYGQASGDPAYTLAVAMTLHPGPSASERAQAKAQAREAFLARKAKERAEAIAWHEAWLARRAAKG